MRRVFVLALSGILMTRPSPLIAQQALSPTPGLVAADQTVQPATASDAAGETVVVWMADQDRAVRGRLIEMTRERVRLVVQGEEAVEQHRSRVVELDLARVNSIDVEEHDSLLDGALLGALVLAACAAWWCSQGTEGAPTLPRDAILGAGLGALVGASIDAKLFESRRLWTGESRPATARQPALRVTLRW